MYNLKASDKRQEGGHHPLYNIVNIESGNDPILCLEELTDIH